MLEAADGATLSPSLSDQANTNRDPPCSQDQHEPGHDQQEDAVACVGLPCSPEERESRERQEEDGPEGSLPHGYLLWVPLGVPLRIPVHSRSLELRDSNTHPDMPLIERVVEALRQAQPAPKQRHAGHQERSDDGEDTSPTQRIVP